MKISLFDFLNLMRGALFVDDKIWPHLHSADRLWETFSFDNSGAYYSLYAPRQPKWPPVENDRYYNLGLAEMVVATETVQ